MSEELRLPEELKEVERALAGLGPVGHGLNRDEVMYEAGRASAAAGARRRVRLWQGACGVMVLAVAGVAVLRPVQTRTVVVQMPGAADRATQAFYLPLGDGQAAGGRTQEGSYLALRNAVLTRGLPTVAPVRGGGTGMYSPALQRGEGLDALPAWQKQGALFGFGGQRS